MSDKPIQWIGTSKDDLRNFPEAVYILRAFGKKTQKTSEQDIELGKKCYQRMIKFRLQL